MKKLLVLAGGSKRNEAWGEACVDYFKDRFDSVDFIRYNHWQTDEPNIDFVVEIEKIKNTATEAGEWYVFAKSIGSILALKAVEAGVIEPTKCVFFGIPCSVIKDSQVAGDWKFFANFTVPALAFHNDNDPTAGYEFTKEKLSEFTTTITFETLHGDTHDYLDFQICDDKITHFLSL